MLLQLAGGGTKEAAEAAEAGDVDALPVEDKYKALLHLCVKLTQHAYKITDEDIEVLRTVGLSDDEILEGVFVACLFNAIDRLADTFGLYDLMQLREQ
jgi:alkylhydroperoxidase family enzyme